MGDECDIHQSKLDELWRNHLDLIKWYTHARPSYEQLANEVTHALRKRLEVSGVEFSSVSCRAKTLDSFLTKLVRKGYEDPKSEIQDLAGVRVVHLYRSDYKCVRNAIEHEFDIVNMVDKVQESGSDHFGYGAVHFVVRLGDRSSGPRYDDLKQLVCEIQVRTALQDAWALISHHLVYKTEHDIPLPLRRRLNSLSGLFETADDQFDMIRTERQEYVKKESAAFKAHQGEKQTIDYDTVIVLLKAELPHLPLERYPGHLSRILQMLNRRKFSSIASLRKLLLATTSASDEFYKKSKYHIQRTAAGALGNALSIVDPEYRALDNYQEDDRALLAELQRQVSWSSAKDGT